MSPHHRAAQDGAPGPSVRARLIRRWLPRGVLAAGLVLLTTGCDAKTVEQALTDAEASGRARPAIQSSYPALVAQLITLGSTFTLLLVWTWRFLVLTS